LGVDTPLPFFLQHFLFFLGRIENDLTSSEQYFSLLNKLINDSCDGAAGGSPKNFTELLQQLTRMIKDHPTVEVIRPYYIS
jgi:hypothetical protein